MLASVTSTGSGSPLSESSVNVQPAMAPRGKGWNATATNVAVMDGTSAGVPSIAASMPIAIGFDRVGMR